MTHEHWSRSLVRSCLEDQPGAVGEWSFSINTPVNDLGPYMLCPFLTDLSLDILLSSNNSAPHSTKALSAYTHRCRRSPENMLFTSTRMLSVQRGQLSHEGLPLLLRHLKVNCRTKGKTDWRLDGPEGYSRGKGNLLCPREEFCLVQLVKSVPWLPLVNRFTVLNIEEVNTDICEPINTPSLFTLDKKLLSWKPKWERRLPKWLSTNTLNAHGTSIILSIEISTTDTSKVHSVKTLLDSKAMGNFIDKDFVHIKGISTQSISRLIPVYNVDSSPNETG